MDFAYHILQTLNDCAFFLTLLEQKALCENPTAAPSAATNYWAQCVQIANYRLCSCWFVYALWAVWKHGVVLVNMVGIVYVRLVSWAFQTPLSGFLAVQLMWPVLYLHCRVSARFSWIMMQSCRTSWGADSRKVSSSRSMFTSAYSNIMAQYQRRWCSFCRRDMMPR